MGWPLRRRHLQVEPRERVPAPKFKNAQCQLKRAGEVDVWPRPLLQAAQKAGHSEDGVGQESLGLKDFSWGSLGTREDRAAPLSGTTVGFLAATGAGEGEES